MIDPMTLVRPNIRSLKPYSTARDEYDGPIGVFLDANENPYDNGLNRYPDPRQRRVKERVAALTGIDPGRIFVGNGSDEAIDLAFRVFCRPGVDNAVSIAPTYGMYGVAAATNDVEFREVALDADFGLEVDRLLAAADERTKLIFVCSPNNPSGNAFRAVELERLLRGARAMVVLDEAYVDFSSEPSLLGRLDEFPNLIVLRTFSKAYGMAGLRVGLAFAAEGVIELFSRVKYPYNINCLTQRALLERLDEPVEGQVREICAERERIAGVLAGLPCVERVYPSEANFLLVRVRGARRLYERLIGAGVIVRDRSQVRGCADCLRITVGRPEENDRMLNLIKEYRYEA